MLVKSKLKYIQSLGQKKPRDEAGVFVAEGPKLVKELLETKGVTFIEIFGTREWVEENQKLLTNNNVEEIKEKELELISQLTSPNKVLAIVKKFDVGQKIVTKQTITLALDTIQDPGNLGTIIRTADWFGIEQIVCSRDCADVYNPKVVQATMGSIARVKVFYVDLEKWLVQQKDIRIYAAVLDGQDVTVMKKINEGIILIGNESKGISDEILKLANVKITIPKKGRAESLNAAVAASIILGHLA
ncbi:MAG TPA: RNA methyltransferase [Chitinophagaceae bacterium]|nr:RNA methyltransferase [Chitinophagaceae bacterium]